MHCAHRSPVIILVLTLTLGRKIRSQNDFPDPLMPTPVRVALAPLLRPDPDQLQKKYGPGELIGPSSSDLFIPPMLEETEKEEENPRQSNRGVYPTDPQATVDNDTQVSHMLC